MTNIGLESFNKEAADVKYFPPEPSGTMKRAIWEYAEKQRERANLSNGFQLHELVSRNGGRISYIDVLDEDQVDAIKIEPDETFVIRLSSLTGALRDNFTIAHELGHKLLHWPKIKRTHPGCGMRATRWVDKSNDALVRCEWEANWFASAFLMPADSFKIAFEKGIASETFGVTDSAVLVRAKTLDLA